MQYTKMNQDVSRIVLYLNQRPPSRTVRPDKIHTSSLYVVDPSNSVLGPYFPPRTTYLFTY